MKKEHIQILLSLLCFVIVPVLVLSKIEFTRDQQLWLGWGSCAAFCMVLLYYPIKRSKLYKILKMKYWFNMHLIGAYIGPMLVFLHSGYKTKSFNASVAYYIMILVILSGLYGFIVKPKNGYWKALHIPILVVFVACMIFHAIGVYLFQ
jgi:hypothetical protein